MNRIAIKPYEIKELYPGHFFMRLDMLDLSDIFKFVSSEYEYLWFYNMIAYRSVWGKPDSSVFSLSNNDIWIRDLRFECIVRAEQLNMILNDLNSSLFLVQLNQLPPSYLRMNNNKMDDRTKYDILNKLDYLFE